MVSFAKRGLVLFSLLMIIGLMPSVLGLGISPGSININYNSGQTVTEYITVHNMDPESKTVKLSIDGRLAEFMTLSDRKVQIEGNSKAEVRLVIVLPTNSQNAGPQVTRVIAEEIVDSAGTIVPTVQVVSKVVVNFPYPDEYLTGDIVTKNIDWKDTGKSFVKIHNMGSKPVVGNIKFYFINPFDEENYYSTDRIFEIDLKESIEESFDIDTSSMIPGEYLSFAEVTYADKTIRLSDDFNVEAFLVEYLDIKAEKFELGEIAKLITTVQNIGNIPVEQFAVEINVAKDGRNVGSIQTDKVNIQPGQTTEVTAYLDTAGYSVGEYSFGVNLGYGDQIEIKQFNVELSNNGMTFKDSIIDGNVEIHEKVSYTKLILVIVVLINIGIIVWLVKRMKEHRDNKKRKKSHSGRFK